MQIPIYIKEFIIDFVNYGLPIIALIGSVYSVITSRKANKVKERVNELEKELKEIQLREKQDELEAAERACIEARIIKESKGRYKMKIWNSGEATAYGVDFSIVGEHQGMVYRDKVPYEFLESQKSFEEHVIVHGSSPDKLIVTTLWKDKDGNEHKKDNMVSI